MATDTATETPSTPPQSRRGWGVAVVSILVTLGAVAVIIAAVVTVTNRDRHETVEFVVPVGTAAKQAAGGAVEIMPPEVELTVGDTLVIRNEDTRDALVGPYRIRAGEVLRQTFTRPQTLVGECSLSGSGEIRIVVT